MLDVHRFNAKMYGGMHDCLHLAWLKEMRDDLKKEKDQLKQRAKPTTTKS